MPFVARRWIGVALVAPLGLAACERESATIRVSRRDRSDATFARRDSNRTLGPGDVRITNADSTFEVAVIGDSLVTGFGPKIIAEIRKKTDTAAVSDNGLGASIEKFVKQTVAGALNHEIKYAIADVQSVRYEGSKLEFFWKDGSRMKLLESTKHNNKPVSETFAPGDAGRLVAAFDARKAAIHR